MTKTSNSVSHSDSPRPSEEVLQDRYYSVLREAGRIVVMVGGGESRDQEETSLWVQAGKICCL
jgi:hypothetical protein